MLSRPDSVGESIVFVLFFAVFVRSSQQKVTIWYLVNGLELFLWNIHYFVLEIADEQAVFR